MKINMQIVLDSEEVKEAVRQFVYEKVSAAGDSPLIIEFPGLDDIDINAVVTIDADDDEVPSTTKAEESFKASSGKRTRRTRAQIEADEAAAKAPVSRTVAVHEAVEIINGLIKESDDIINDVTDDKPPFDVDEKADTVLIFKPNGTTETVQIFPNVGTSAPVMPQPEIPANVGAKSLFANLSSPATAN